MRYERRGLKMKYYIGIDGGATRTVGLISDLSGTLLGRIETGPVNYHKESIELLEENLTKNIEQLLLRVKGNVCDVKKAVMGVSGIDRPAEKRMIKGFLSKLGIARKTMVFNDAVIALKGGTKKGYGIVIIAGTGSIVYGVNKKGKARRVGGWGDVLGDIGSGYDIGVRALKAIMHAFDGQGPKTKMTKLVLRKLGLKKFNDLVLWLDKCVNVKLDVSELAYQLFSAYELKDKVAKKILDEVANEFCQSAKIVAKELDIKRNVEIVLSGGLFLKNLIYFEVMKNQLLEHLPHAKVVFPYHEPAYGALMIARGI